MSARDAEIEAKLARTWADAPGLRGFLATTDHKRIGRRYLVTAMVFFALAGVLALVMRTQLGAADNHLVGPDRYAQLFSLHGSAMMFLFAVPVMTAMGAHLVPLMLGARVTMNEATTSAATHSADTSVKLTICDQMSVRLPAEKSDADSGTYAVQPASGPASSANAMKIVSPPNRYTQ